MRGLHLECVVLVFREREETFDDGGNLFGLGLIVPRDSLIHLRGVQTIHANKGNGAFRVGQHGGAQHRHDRGVIRRSNQGIVIKHGRGHHQHLGVAAIVLDQVGKAGDSFTQERHVLGSPVPRGKGCLATRELPVQRMVAVEGLGRDQALQERQL